MSVIGGRVAATTARSPFGGFFVPITAALLAFVVVAFGPTFYFRWYFESSPLPTYLFVHGIALTAWFVWLLLQGVLVNVNMRSLHRRLGVAGAVIGYAALATGLIATLKMPARVHAANAELPLDTVGISIQFWINTGLTVAIAVLLTAAILLRRKPEPHKRLMLAASITMMPAPVAHIFGAGTPMVPATILAMFLSLCVYDFVHLRRIHTMTWLPIAGVFALVGSAAGLIGPSSFGQAIVTSLIRMG